MRDNFIVLPTNGMMALFARCVLCPRLKRTIGRTSTYCDGIHPVSPVRACANTDWLCKEIHLGREPVVRSYNCLLHPNQSAGTNRIRS